LTNVDFGGDNHADFRCRMAGHEDYLDAGGADQYGSYQSIREKVQLVQIHDPDTLGSFGGERMFDSGEAGQVLYLFGPFNAR